MEQIVNYIENTYEFEIVPCSIPASDFQYIKRNFYIWIMNSVSKKLFYFLRDKVSPIKFLEERPDGTIWLRKRMSDNKLCEIEIKTIYLYDHSTQVKLPDGNYSFPTEYHNYSIRLVNDYLYVHNLDEIQIEKLDTILIDKHLGQYKELKQFLRNKKLENILNN
jgi:hypothetical protein